MPFFMCIYTFRCMKMYIFQIILGMLLRNLSLSASYTVGVFPHQHIKLHTILLLRTKLLSSLGLIPKKTQFSMS